jgi:hypothetical protein
MFWAKYAINRCNMYKISNFFFIFQLLKGTVARDFRPLVFPTIIPHKVPEFTPQNIFEFCFEFAEIFVFKVVPRGLIPRRTLFRGVWYPQNLVRRSIRPRRMLFCRVSDPAEKDHAIKYTHLCPCSAGSDTLQDLVPRGLIPSRILFCGVWYLAGFCSAGYQTLLAN